MLLDNALKIVIEELHIATNDYKEFNSMHEGYAVIKEEFDELWDSIKSKECSIEDIRDEAKQVVAMGIRFLMDCC